MQRIKSTLVGLAAIASSASCVDSNGATNQQRATWNSVSSALCDPLPPGSPENPARTCGELHVANMPSGVYWVRPVAGDPAFQVYCEQTLNGGGWAMLANSVNGAGTTAFWQFGYADRLSQLGTPAPDQNYYQGALYTIGTDYMDVFVDLQDKSAVVAVMTASGFNTNTMQAIAPSLTLGNTQVFNSQFASGWSARDFDGDAASINCASFYTNIAQHYSNCWAYNLGSDGDSPIFDGGVGPHVNNRVLTELGLAIQPNGGVYSQVRRIARFTRW